MRKNENFRKILTLQLSLRPCGYDFKIEAKCRTRLSDTLYYQYLTQLTHSLDFDIKIKFVDERKLIK